MILCAASIYEKKYYIDPQFETLPEQVRNELQAACVMFVEEVSGIIILQFDPEGHLFISTEAKDSDGFYDEIGASLKIKQLQKDKAQLFEQLELYYKVFVQGDLSAAKDLVLDEDDELAVELEEMRETEGKEMEEYDEDLEALLEALGVAEIIVDDED